MTHSSHDSQLEIPKWKFAILLFLCIALMIALDLVVFNQWWNIRSRGIDPDELEHLHAAYCVHLGQLPYRDFFEHHGPGLYFLIQPLFWLAEDDLQVLWMSRRLMGLFGLVSLGITGLLAWKLSGRVLWLFFSFWLLSWSSVFHIKTIELRPDVPAMAIFMLAVYLVVRNRDGFTWKSALPIGVLLGIATLFTQKSVVPAAGLLLGLLLSGSARVTVWIGLGMLVPWAIAIGLFAIEGAAGSFLYCTVWLLWSWPVRIDPLVHLRPMLVSELTLWVLGIWEALALVIGWQNPETRSNGLLILAICVLTCVFSLLWVKAAYPQYYLTWIPLLSVLAARRLLILFEISMGRKITKVATVGATLLFLMQGGLLLRAVSMAEDGPLPHLTTGLPWNSLILSWLFPVGIILLFLILAVIMTVRRSEGESTVFALAMMGMYYGMLRNIDMNHWSNQPQIAAIEAVHEQVGPDEKILDGFTGLGVLRPHAWYYWWINEHSLRLIPPEELEGLLALLERDRPKAVLLDENLQKLPTEVVEWLQRNYRKVEPEPLHLRIDSRTTSSENQPSSTEPGQPLSSKEP